MHHAIHPFKVCDSVVFSVSPGLCKHPHGFRQGLPQEHKYLPSPTSGWLAAPGDVRAHTLQWGNPSQRVRGAGETGALGMWLVSAGQADSAQETCPARSRAVYLISRQGNVAGPSKAFPKATCSEGHTQDLGEPGSGTVRAR